MNQRLLYLLVLTCTLTSFGPPNCNLYKGDEACYEACREAEHAIRHGQGSRASQIHFDKSIELCPTFAYSYYEKCVPYAKRGLNSSWKPLMDKAVELSPEEYLGIRGWYHYLFMKNYEAAIEDIEAYEDLLNYDIGPTGSGEYHLHIIRALSYKGLGKKEKAVEIIQELLSGEDYDPGLYDYFHLGVMLYELNDLDGAAVAFEQQIELNNFAGIHYYLGLVAEKKNNYEDALGHMSLALEKYKAGNHMNNAYTFHADRVFLQEIELKSEELEKSMADNQ